MAPRYIKTLSSSKIEKIFQALYGNKVHPVAKGGATSYYKPGLPGLVTVTHRLMFGGPDELKAKVEKCGFTVRVADCNDFHTWVTFDVPKTFFNKES